MLLTAGGDGRLIEWNVADGRRIETFTGHAGAAAVTIAPNGRTAYSAGQDGTLIARDLAGNRRLDRPFSAPPRSAQVFPDEGRGSLPTDFGGPWGLDVPVAGFAVATTRDGSRFIVPDDAGYVDVFNGRTLTHRIALRPGGQVAAAAVAADGRTLAALTADGHLGFADARSGQRLGPLRFPYRDAAWSLALSGDGRWLATAGFPIPSLRLWDVRRRTIVSTSFLSPFTIAADVAFSPDGSRLAVAVNDGAGATAIQILSVPSLDRLSTVPAPEVRSVRFSPDGRLLVFGDEQGRVQLYDTRTSRPHGPPLVGHTGGVVTANFSPDGQTLVTTSDDGTTRLWDVSSGRPIGNALPGPAQHYVAAAFVDHGRHLVTLYDDGRGYLWDIRPQFGPRRACAVAGRTLTRAEWKDALPERTYAPACSRR